MLANNIWNPFIYNKENNKEYYQRDFVWGLNDKQLLIESIYNNIDCGKILITKEAGGKSSLMLLVKKTLTTSLRRMKSLNLLILFIQLPIWAAIICTIIGGVILFMAWILFLCHIYEQECENEYREEEI